jgi:hypothetical protein
MLRAFKELGVIFWPLLFHLRFFQRLPKS